MEEGGGRAEELTASMEAALVRIRKNVLSAPAQATPTVAKQAASPPVVGEPPAPSVQDVLSELPSYSFDASEPSRRRNISAPAPGSYMLSTYPSPEQEMTATAWSELVPPPPPPGWPTPTLPGSALSRLSLNPHPSSLSVPASASTMKPYTILEFPASAQVPSTFTMAAPGVASAPATLISASALQPSSYPCSISPTPIFSVDVASSTAPMLSILKFGPARQYPLSRESHHPSVDAPSTVVPPPPVVPKDRRSLATSSDGSRPATVLSPSPSPKVLPVNIKYADPSAPPSERWGQRRVPAAKPPIAGNGAVVSDANPVPPILPAKVALRVKGIPRTQIHSGSLFELLLTPTNMSPTVLLEKATQDLAIQVRTIPINVRPARHLSFSAEDCHVTDTGCLWIRNLKVTETSGNRRISLVEQSTGCLIASTDVFVNIGDMHHMRSVPEKIEVTRGGLTTIYFEVLDEGGNAVGVPQLVECESAALTDFSFIVSRKKYTGGGRMWNLGTAMPARTEPYTVHFKSRKILTGEYMTLSLLVHVLPSAFPLQVDLKLPTPQMKWIIPPGRRFDICIHVRRTDKEPVDNLEAVLVHPRSRARGTRLPFNEADVWYYYWPNVRALPYAGAFSIVIRFEKDGAVLFSYPIRLGGGEPSASALTTDESETEVSETSEDEPDKLRAVLAEENKLTGWNLAKLRLVRWVVAKLHGASLSEVVTELASTYPLSMRDIASELRKALALESLFVQRGERFYLRDELFAPREEDVTEAKALAAEMITAEENIIQRDGAESEILGDLCAVSSELSILIRSVIASQNGASENQILRGVLPYLCGLRMPDSERYFRAIGVDTNVWGQYVLPHIGVLPVHRKGDAYVLRAGSAAPSAADVAALKEESRLRMMMAQVLDSDEDVENLKLPEPPAMPPPQTVKITLKRKTPPSSLRASDGPPHRDLSVLSPPQPPTYPLPPPALGLADSSLVTSLLTEAPLSLVESLHGAPRSPAAALLADFGPVVSAEPVPATYATRAAHNPQPARKDEDADVIDVADYYLSWEAQQASQPAAAQNGEAHAEMSSM